ncbi:MAG: Bax inhibitor-1/YccA family protein [Opitutales bacterium]
MDNSFRTSNPALLGDTFDRSAMGPVMTLQGTINKTGLLLLFVIAGAVTTWDLAVKQDPLVNILLGVGVFGGMIVAFVTIFKKEWSPVTAPIYAILEGLALGGISSIINLKYPGIAIEAVSLTFGVFVIMLALYWTRIVRATPLFVRGVIAATGAIMLVYVVNLVLGFFGSQIPFINSAGNIGIGFSIFVVVIAAFNLVIDFAFIEQGAREGSPRYMEWYGAFALLVTLVWLYLEILRLLAKLNSRQN